MDNFDFNPHIPSLAKELPFAVTVCNTEGFILYMNDRSIKTFEKYGGASLVGKSLFDYHPPLASDKLRFLLSTGTSNAYTIAKNGIRKMIYQSPWYKDGKFAGLVELSLEIPVEMPHFIRP